MEKRMKMKKKMKKERTREDRKREGNKSTYRRPKKGRQFGTNNKNKMYEKKTSGGKRKRKGRKKAKQKNGK